MAKIIKSILVLVFGLGLLIPYASAQYGGSGKLDADNVRKSRDKYVEALAAYNNADKDKGNKSLQEAIDSIRNTDAHLADLMSQLKSGYNEQGSLFYAPAKQIAIIFNTYNSDYNLGYPMFNPGNPTLAIAQEGT